MASIALITICTLLSGLGDAQGFIHASRVWQDGRFVWNEALLSAAGFQFGVVMYWLALHGLTSQGVVHVEIQTLFWFGATIVGIALISGRFLHWTPIDQATGVVVLAGIGWLLYRTAGVQVT